MRRSLRWTSARSGVGLSLIRSKEVVVVCYEHELDRQVHEDEEQVADEIRRLFERYRSSGRLEAEAMRALADEAREPVLAAR
jgi:hypothetical protein